MNILFCSDGSTQAENAIRFGGWIAGVCQAQATLLGIAEKQEDHAALLAALHREKELLQRRQVNPQIVVETGEPVSEILEHTREHPYDLVVIGAVRKGTRGPFWMSAKAYALIKVLPVPVLIVIGQRATLRRILICSGGRSYIENAVKLTGQITRCTQATVTLIHVMAQPPPIYTRLAARETAESVLRSPSGLGQNLRREKEMLEAFGIRTEVRVRHGDVIPELQAEIREGNYDLVVLGSPAKVGPFRTYLMGDIAREVVNRAECPVLVVRGAESPKPPAGFSRLFTQLKGALGRSDAQ